MYANRILRPAPQFFLGGQRFKAGQVRIDHDLSLGLMVNPCAFSCCSQLSKWFSYVPFLKQASILESKTQHFTARTLSVVL
jgi:hypothetical protein